MTRIRFTGDSPTCAWLGVGFVNGEWAEVQGLAPESIARFQAHPDFDVEAEAKAEAAETDEPAAKPAKASKSPGRPSASLKV